MITTCSKCGICYEAGSNEVANEPIRYCFSCREQEFDMMIKEHEDDKFYGDMIKEMDEDDNRATEGSE